MQPPYEPRNNEKQTPSARKRLSPWTLLLLLPYLGLCFPQVYMREIPLLWGVPFFYWYQFVWIVLAAAIMGMVYHKLEN
jgi:hypothetical protein